MNDDLKPKFSQDLPQGWQTYFRRDSDDEYKRKYPKRYALILTIGYLVLFMPMVIYFAYVFFINPAPNSPFLVSGLFGTLFIGSSFFLIVGAWVHQYLGHKVTIICFLIGMILTIGSLVFLY